MFTLDFGLKIAVKPQRKRYIISDKEVGRPNDVCSEYQHFKVLEIDGGNGCIALGMATSRISASVIYSYNLPGRRKFVYNSES